LFKLIAYNCIIIILRIYSEHGLQVYEFFVELGGEFGSSGRVHIYQTEMDDSEPSDGVEVKNRKSGLTLEPIMMLMCLGINANREYL